MNYSELKAAVLSYIDHDDNNDVALWIELARAKINRKLSTMSMICRATVTIEEATDKLNLPSDWAGARTVLVNGKPVDPRGASTFATEAVNRANIPGTYYFSLQNKKIYFASSLAVDDEVTLLYYRKVPQLVEDTDVNWLLEEHPDCWLYAAVAEGHVFTMDEERVNFYNSLRDKIFEEIEEYDTVVSWSGTPNAVISA